jgi:hypothetical protein
MNNPAFINQVETVQKQASLRGAGWNARRTAIFGIPEPGGAKNMASRCAAF